MNKEIRTIILKRLFITIGILVLIRVGSFLPIPGINHSDLAFYIASHSITRSLINTFSGNSTFVIGLFTLNIFPYINASIFMQVIIGLSPKLTQFQKDGEFEGKRIINRLTRIVTLVFAGIQSLSLSIYLRQILFDWNYILAVEIIIWLTSGAMIIVWLSELITDYGLGNGTSILIYANILSNLPNLAKSILLDNLSLISKIGIFLLIFVSLYGIVFLQEGYRNIPLISSKQLNQTSLQDTMGNDEFYIPLRLNQAGVMPIILTTTILVIPNYINNLGLFPKINFDKLAFIYWIAYFSLILLFSMFYSMIVLNPKDMADQLQKMAVAIPGIRPGIQTRFYLKQVMERITLIGGVILGILVTVPNFIESTFNLTSFNGLSTTSLLILAGVVLDLNREIKNIYFSNVYNDMDS